MVCQFPADLARLIAICSITVIDLGMDRPRRLVAHRAVIVMGNGWTQTFKRQLQVAAHALTVVNGAGQSNTYNRNPLGGFNTATSGTASTRNANAR